MLPTIAEVESNGQVFAMVARFERVVDPLGGALFR